MQTPPCAQGGSHCAFRSNTKPTATPRGASDPPEQRPVRRASEKRGARTTDPGPEKPMAGSGSVSQGRQAGRLQTGTVQQRRGGVVDWAVLMRGADRMMD